MSARGRFPLYRLSKPPEREYCLLENFRILTEHGEIIPAADWQEIRDALADGGRVVLVGRLASQPWIYDAAADPDACVLVNGNTLSAIRVLACRDRRRCSWLVPVTSWCDQRVPTPELLTTLRTVVDAGGVGAAATPAALGRLLLKRGWESQPLYPPNRWAWNILKDTLVGGRVDPIPLGRRQWPEAWGQDLTAAYLWAACDVPAGTTEWFYGEPLSCYETYYANACVTIDPGIVPLGPLPLRCEHKTDYPCEGHLDGWYWNEELDACRALGARIEIFKGYGWRSRTRSLAPGVTESYRLRRALSPLGASIIKRASLAALGSMASSYVSTRAVPAREDSQFWTPPGAERPLTLVSEEREREGMLVHLFSYISMKVRMRTWEQALPYAARHALVGTYVDELVTTEEPPDPEEEGMGQWKKTRYGNLRVGRGWQLHADEVREIRPMGLIA